LDQRSGKLWIIKAFGIFLLGLILWFLLAIWTGKSFALDLQFAQDLRSALSANYGEGPSDQNMNFINLTILGDVFSDQGISEESFESLEDLLLNPVPTATMAGDPELAFKHPTNNPSPSPDFTSTAMAMETENDITISSMTETATTTLTPTYTGTSTATGTFTPTSTKTTIPTKTPSPTMQPSKTSVIDDVQPILECVEYKGGGMWRAYFGYFNQSAETQVIPIGDRNRFKPDPKDRGQTTTFLPGRSGSYPDVAFSVDFEESIVLTWYLTVYTVQASRTSEYCDSIFIPSPTPTEATTPLDTHTPILSGGDLDPQPGWIHDCSVEVLVEALHVEDPPFSSGLQWVKLKYVVGGYGFEGYSEPLTLEDGGATAEGGWSGEYRGSATINIDTEWQSPEPDPFIIEIWGKAKDNVSLEGIYHLGTYNMPSSCGKSPE
jgi:hypothetical protein